MASNVNFKNFINNTEAFKDADGYWNVTVRLTERDSVDGEKWREESVSALSIDKDFDNAHLTSLRSVLQFIDEHVHSKGFSTLTDAAEFFKALEEKSDKEKPDNNAH